MDWATALNVGGPIAGLIVGGLFTRKKTKADSHSVIVTDSISYAKSLREDLEERDRRDDERDRRLDALEAKMLRRDNLARAHIRWDWQMIEKLRDAGIEVPDNPPPLFVFDD